jgi:hypothetical protein
VPLQVERRPDAPADWDGFVRERGLFYHFSRWIAGLSACFGYPVHWLAARDGESLAGVLALAEVPSLFRRPRLVSFPFSYAAGPVATDREAAFALFRAARDLAGERRASLVEVKQLGTAEEPAAGYVRSTRYSTYRLHLDGGEPDIWKRLNADSTRRGIRKAEKAGVRVGRAGAAADWEAFAGLEDVSARDHGLPAPPRSFFRDLCPGLQSEGLADLYLAHLADGRLAAGVVIWKGLREWIYAFNASSRGLLEDRPNHALLWRVIRDAGAYGAHFDLGRAAPEQTGLVDFKLRWGGQPIPLAYDYWPAAHGLNVARRDTGTLAAAARLWRLLPLPVARLGSRLYRYLG